MSPGDLFRDMQDYALVKIQGPAGGIATPDQPDVSSVQTPTLSPKGQIFRRNIKRQILKEELTAKALGIALEAPKQAQSSLFWLGRQMDRPRNAVANTIVGAMQGVPAGDLYEKFWKGFKGEERATAEDMFAQLSPAARFSVGAGLAAGTGNKLSVPQVMWIASRGLDVAMDPATWVPGSWLAKPFRIAGAGVKLGARAIGREEALKDILHGTFLRGSRLVDKNLASQMNELNAMRIDDLQYASSELFNKAVTIEQSMKGMRKAHKGLASKLAEETSLPHVEQFLSNAAQGKITPERASAMLQGFDYFRNPETVGEIMRLTPEHQQTVLGTAKQLQDLGERIQAIHWVTGKRVPELGHEVVAGLEKAKQNLREATHNEVFRRWTAAETQRSTMGAAIAAKKQMLETTIGKDKINQMVRDLHQATLTEAAVVKRGKVDPNFANDVFRRYLEKNSPEFLAGLTQIGKDKSAAEAIYQKATNNILAGIQDVPKIRKAAEEVDLLDDAVRKLPRWVSHVLTPDAMTQMAKTGKIKGWGAFLRTPRTAMDITRQFVEQVGKTGVYRPLSIEEVEKFVESGNYWRTLGAKGIPKNHGILSFMKPPELAKFLDTDERTILASTVQKTARSYANAQFLNQVAGTFGVKGGVGRTLAQQYPQLAAEMPHLANHAFDPLVLKEAVELYSSFVNPQPVLRIFDTMQGWWKAHQLFLFPWYHTRNAISNVFFMHQGGFGRGPDAGRDLLDWAKTTWLQAKVTGGDIQGARNLKFYVKGLGQEVNGYDIHRMALMNGVIDAGWYGADAGMKMASKTEPWLQWKGFVPFTRQNLAMRAGAAAGKAIENNQRLAYFVTQLRKGSSVREASALVKKFMGDYRTDVMTPFEAQVAGRFMPFYRFARFNLPLQVEQFILNNTNRAEILTALRLGGEAKQKVIQDPDRDKPVPGWVEDMVGVPMRRNPGNGLYDYMLFKNFLPQADLEDVISAASFTKEGLRSAAKEILMQTTPALKMPIEFVMGRPIMQAERELAGEKTELFGKLHDAEFVNFLRNMRLVSEWDKLDPFGTYHQYRKRPPRITTMFHMLGPSVPEVNLDQSDLEWKKKQLEYDQRRIAEARKTIQLMEQKKRRAK